MRFPTPIGQFQYHDKYARFNYELGRRETWDETVCRTIEYLKDTLYLRGKYIPPQIWYQLEQGILDLQVMPSMRNLAMAGPAARRNNLCSYNCAYTPIEDIGAFYEAVIILMSGSGLGYSVEERYIQKLPLVQKQHGKKSFYAIPDTTEGWAEAVRLGIAIWISGTDVEFDYSQIRPSGAPLVTKGGRASGPEHLQQSLVRIRELILQRQGLKLRSLDVHDIMCHIARAIVSGGVRRSALLCLFDMDDELMLHCKDDGQLEGNEQRWNANNSVVVNGPMTYEEISLLMDRMDASGRGEPGIFNRWAANNTRPERRMRANFGTNPCLTGDSLVAVADGRGHVPIGDLAKDGADVPVFCLDEKGRMAIRWLRHPRVTGHKPVYKITLDDGSSVRATGNHKFRLKNGQYIAVTDLVPGDGLHVMTRYKASIKDVFKEKGAKSQDYVWVNNGRRKNVAEHRLIAAFYNDAPIPKGHVVHHVDFDASNNDPLNLKVLPRAEHDALHGDRMRGKNNPIVRAKEKWSEQKWDEYRKKMSCATRGQRNGRYSGATHDQIKHHALVLTRNLGRRFSTKDWQLYAKEHDLPQAFSKWRRDHLGGILGMAKWAALEIGIDHIEADPRVVKSYWRYGEMGYDCEIVNGSLSINKLCEVCQAPFSVSIQRRESGVCSRSCSGRQNWRLNRDAILAAHRRAYDKKRRNTQGRQLDVYTELQFGLNRAPLKTEWVEACKGAGVSHEISRPSSPFRTYANLQEAAEMHNHRVVSVEFSGYEDVYNGTVDEYHNFFVGGWESTTRNSKGKWAYINNRQCGEIVLKNRGLCNLTSVVCRKDDTLPTLLNKTRLATILGTIQAMSDFFPGLRDEWGENAVNERLLGVDLNGVMDCEAARDPKVLSYLKDHVIHTNKIYSLLLGINQSVATTCIKPSGNSSTMLGTSPGIHARWSPYYIRRVYIQAESPLRQLLQAQGVPIEPQLFNHSTWIASFPTKSPDGAITRDDMSALAQCENWLTMKKNYTEHNPSVTITYKPHELSDLKSWLFDNQDHVCGMAFLPHSESKYEQMPYEEISGERYRDMMATFPDIKWEDLPLYEDHDMTNVSGTYACSSDKCVYVP